MQLVEEQESGHHTVVECNKCVSVLVSFLVSNTNVLDHWYRVVLSLSVIILYIALGLIGRYRLIHFSLWVQWITVIMSTSSMQC